VLEVDETVRGENLLGANAAEVTPVVAVRSCTNGCVVVCDVFGGELERPAGENDVVLAGEGFLGERRGCYDHDASGAETEGKDWAVLVGVALEETVDRRFHEVEMADEGS